jgi:putative DNA primase/helicase
VVEYVDGVRDWPDFPPLRGIATAPILTPEGRILSRPGYDRGTGLVYAGEPFDVPEGAPSDAARAAALALLADLLGDFPFTDEAAQAHALAHGLLPFVRPSFAGAAPLYLVDKPTPRTGASLLCHVLAAPFTGANGPRVITSRRNEEETRKALFAALLQGVSHAVIDNLPAKLDSASLAAVLTAPQYDDRVLGESRLESVRNRVAWALTAKQCGAVRGIGRPRLLDAPRRRPRASRRA